MKLTNCDFYYSPLLLNCILVNSRNIRRQILYSIVVLRYLYSIVVLRYLYSIVVLRYLYSIVVLEYLYSIVLRGPEHRKHDIIDGQTIGRATQELKKTHI
jgi:hypothetical protein